MRIPESTLSEIRDRLDIAEVIGEHVALQRKGGRYWGLCPFHQEKSPSFTVTPDKGVFYCFGCHKGGTVFDFVMEVEKVPWRDAVEILAKKAGIEIPREDEEHGRDQAGDLLRAVPKGRGQLPLAADGGRAGGGGAKVPREPGSDAGDARQVPARLCTAGPRLAVQVPDAEELFGGFPVPDGVVRRERAEPRSVSLFANRIMFPISNPRGEIIAFGGRVLGEGQPKYLNSPETAFFRKGENLFGMDKRRPRHPQGGVLHPRGRVHGRAGHAPGWFRELRGPAGNGPHGAAGAAAEALRSRRRSCSSTGTRRGGRPPRVQSRCWKARTSSSRWWRFPAAQDPADFVKKGDVVALKGLLEHPQDSFPYLVEKALAAHDAHGGGGQGEDTGLAFSLHRGPASASCAGTAT